MKTLARFSFLSTLVLAFVFFLAPSAAKAADEDAGKQVATVTVPSGLSQQNVKDCVLKGLVGRRWILKEKTDSLAIGHYENGRNAATVTVKFDTTKVEIFAVGHTSKAGELPMRWIENLKKDIETFMNREFAKK